MRVSSLVAAVTVAAVAVAGCETTESSGPTVEQEIAARRGAEVGEVCFMRGIQGWSPLGDHALLLRRGVNDWYMVELTGVCRPDEAFAGASLAVGRTVGGSSCLRPGDNVATREPGVGSMVCAITSIYEWDEDAPVPETPEDASDG